MYFYQLLIVIIVFFSIREVFSKNVNNSVFNFVYFLLILMATFRYGQLGDYFGYMYLYNYPQVIMAKDPGFGLLILLFRSFNIDYTIFMSSLSFLCMVMMYPFFKKTCGRSFIALLIFYSYTFIYGPMGAIRQGICLALLLWMYPLLINEKYKMYVLFVILGCFIHLSFIIAFIFPFFIRWRIFHRHEFVAIIIFFTIIGFLGINFTNYLPEFLKARTYTKTDVVEGAGILQIGLRLLIILPLLFYKAKENTNAYYAKAICLMGYCVYCLFSSDSLVAGRLEFYMRIFICMFVGYIIYNEGYKFKKQFIPFIFLLVSVHIVIWYKNMDFVRENGGYLPNITVYNMPFVSILNQNDIDEYALIRYDNEVLMKEP